MYGEINKQYYMGEHLTSLRFVKEVYADPKFDFAQHSAAFVLLCSQEIPAQNVLYRLSELFAEEVRVYVVYDQYSALLKDKRIIWREGVWYL